jgi:hypothetical protein
MTREHVREYVMLSVDGFQYSVWNGFHFCYGYGLKCVRGKVTSVDAALGLKARDERKE